MWLVLDSIINILVLLIRYENLELLLKCHRFPITEVCVHLLCYTCINYNKQDHQLHNWKMSKSDFVHVNCVYAYAKSTTQSRA